MLEMLSAFCREARIVVATNLTSFFCNISSFGYLWFVEKPRFRQSSPAGILNLRVRFKRSLGWRLKRPEQLNSLEL